MSETITMNETDAIHRRIAEANASSSKRKSSTPESSPVPKKSRPSSSPLREVKENGLTHSDHNGTGTGEVTRVEMPAPVPMKSDISGEHGGAENSQKDASSSPEKLGSARRKSQSPTKFTFVPKSMRNPEAKPEMKAEERMDSPDSVRKSNRTPKKSQKLIENEETREFFGETIRAESRGSPVKSSDENVNSDPPKKRSVVGRPMGSKNKKPRPDIGKRRGKRKVSLSSTPDTAVDPRFGGKINIPPKQKTTEKVPEPKGPRIKVSGPFSSPKSIKFLDQEEEKKEAKIPKVVKELPRLYRASAVLTEDVNTVDETWTCIFCHKHSHERGLGDLFGPYYVTLPDEPDEEFLPATRRRATSESRTEPDELEVWFHERCLYWAPNIYMLAGKIIGLEVIIGELRNSECNHCHSDGATIACYHRGCENRSHFPCAIGKWQLIDNNYRCYCPSHHI